MESGFIALQKAFTLSQAMLDAANSHDWDKISWLEKEERALLLEAFKHPVVFNVKCWREITEKTLANHLAISDKLVREKDDIATFLRQLPDLPAR